VNEAASIRRGLWGKLHGALSGSIGDDPELERLLQEAAARAPVPVLWLLGMAQSGKTSIVRALTGSSRAEIGNGFQPCTRAASVYDFPPEAPVVRFLDTRGLGEVNYIPDEDIALCEARAHLVIAVIRLGDAQPKVLLEVLRSVRRRHPEWPLIIAQTCLHEAYPAGQEHIQPYPFNEPDWQQRVPADLRRLLLAQREQIGRLPGHGHVRWVPIDFTRKDDGFEPANYGIEALWLAIEEASSLGLEARLRADPMVGDARSRAAHPHIVGYSLTAATVGALPVADIAVVPLLQARLLRQLATLYQLSWTPRSSAEFLGLLGGGLATAYGLHLAGRSVVKLIPAWGQTVGAVWGASASAATTYALGKAACAYLARRREGRSIEAAHLRGIYREALLRGRRLPHTAHHEHPPASQP